MNWNRLGDFAGQVAVTASIVWLYNNYAVPYGRLPLDYGWVLFATLVIREVSDCWPKRSANLP